MKLTLAHITPHSAGRAKMGPIEALVAYYVTRSRPWAQVDAKAFPSEAHLLQSIAAISQRMRPLLCLLESSGEPLSSEQFASAIKRWRDGGQQHVFLCIGPADGWSATARERADLLLSLGPMTLAHGIARVVLAEQVYRALSILAGHPYHGGH